MNVNSEQVAHRPLLGSTRWAVAAGPVQSWQPQSFSMRWSMIDQNCLQESTTPRSSARRSAAIGWVSAHDIDCMGIMQATRTAMQQAIFGLSLVPDALLVDAVTFDRWCIPQQNLIHGDSRSLSIAAASIVAKVARDRVMSQLARTRPEYGFASHKGYGTALHQAALRRHGPSSQHRHSYAPIRFFHMTGQWGFGSADAHEL
jgi:hypothetical protein